MKHQRGFTLIEILVAVTVISLLLSTIYGVFSTTSEAKRKVEEKAAAVHLGRVIFSRIDRELLGLSLSTDPRQTVLEGGTNDRGEPYLAMLSNAGEGPQEGLARIRYRLVAGDDTDPDAGFFRDSGAAYQPADEMISSRLSGMVEAFSLRFNDGGGWRQNWDSNRDGIPKLVEVSLRLKLGDGSLPLHTIFQPPRGGTP